MEDRGGNVVGNVRQRVVCSGTTKKACVTRSRANKREATDESTSTGGPIASCASSTPERGGAPVTKMKPLPLSNSVLTKRRSTTKVSGAVDRQSWQRFLETMNAVSLFSVVRQLQLQHRKYPVSSQRTRTLTPHQGSMFCKPSTVLFPPGALPENLVVWIYCIKDMPAQPKSVASCHPWHLGKILYCKPAPGFTLGYLHHSGVPESVNTYLMEWTVNGPPSTSIGSQSSTQFQSCHNASPVTNPSLSCVSSRRSTQSSYSLLDHVDKSLPRAAESREREDDVSNDPPLTSCHISQQHDNATSHASRLTLDPSLRLDLVTGASSMSCICPSDEAVAACAPWQFLYYVHYQGYNRRYDRWVSLDELRPSIIDPHTNRVCASALARHYISALHSLGHPKWKSYTADSKNTPTTPFPSPDVKGTISGDAKENFSSEASHAQAALLALRLLSSLLYHWAVGYESNRGRRDMTHLIDWCCNFWKSPGDEGPLMFTRERRALLWVSQLLFSYFQLDAIDLYTSALRASKKKKKSSCSNVSSLTPTTPVLESDVVWGPLRSMWTAAVELLEHRRGIACSLLNDKTRPLNSIWETVMLPSRSRDTCKVPMSSLLMSIIEAVVHRIMNHRGSLYEQPLVFFRNYSCVDTFDDIHSDDGEHEGIDPASIEVIKYARITRGTVLFQAHEAMTKLRTIDTLQIDNYVVATWYYSPFPLRFHPAERVYICGGCLCYFFYEAELKRHEQLCTQLRPPGHEIYRDGRYTCGTEMMTLRETDACCAALACPFSK